MDNFFSKMHEINTEIDFTNEIVKQYYQDHRDRMVVSTLNLREIATRNSLIQMGWTPPNNKSMVKNTKPLTANQLIGVLDLLPHTEDWASDVVRVPIDEFMGEDYWLGANAVSPKDTYRFITFEKSKCGKEWVLVQMCEY